MTGRVASLGMYDRPEVRAANDALWSAVAAHLRAAGVEGVPAELDRTRGLGDIWNDPGLLLAQCCGYPLVTAWRDRLRYVATPVYAVPGCEGGTHRSRIVVRRGESALSLAAFRGRRAAINDRGSNTGMNLLRDSVARMADKGRFFGSIIETGSHDASARLVAAGGADIAAIDTVSFAHFEGYEPSIAGRLRVLGWTRPVPGLPLVTAGGTTDRELALLRAAVRAALVDPRLATARAALHLSGVEILRRERYDIVARIEAKAVRNGYPVLA